jgi:hypothetical protein
LKRRCTNRLLVSEVIFISCKKLAKKNAQEQSSDYLGKFLELIKPYILPHKWEDVHKQARAFAGGKAAGRNKLITPAESLAGDEGGGAPGSELTIESIQIGPGILRREGPYIISPVHLTHEGVANRTLKKWDQIYDPEGIDGIHSFEGRPITRSHPPFGGADETTPTLGKLRNVIADTEKKRADCEAWLVEKRLTGKELDALNTGQQVPGSIGYRSAKTYLDAPKRWDDGNEYDAEIKAPLFGDHYAMLGENEEPACPICGFNVPKEQLEIHSNECKLMNRKHEHDNDTGSKAGSGDTDTMSEVDIPAQPDIKSVLDESLKPITETMTKFGTAFEDLSKRLATVEGANKTLTETIQKEKADAATKLDTEQKAEFKEGLNAKAAVDVDILWKEVKDLNPVQFKAWEKKNPDKLLTVHESKTLKGQKTGAAVGGSAATEARQKMIAARNKTLGYTKE